MTTTKRWRGPALIGAIALFLAVLVLWVPGVIFNGSVTQVGTLCASPYMAALLQRANHAACHEATTAAIVE